MMTYAPGAANPEARLNPANYYSIFFAGEKAFFVNLSAWYPKKRIF